MKFNIYLVYNLTVLGLDIYLRGMKTFVLTKTWTWMFIAVLHHKWVKLKYK
jgi:hypothetical protein